MLLIWVFLLLGILVGVAFITLYERKVLGYVQYRSGPNSVSYLGVLQALTDALKLFFKEFFFLLKGNMLMYMFGPFLGLFILLSIWFITPYYFNLLDMGLGFCFLISVLALGVYPLLIGAWSSNSKYSLLGGIRGVAQSISYEVSLVLLMLGFFFFTGKLGFGMFIRCQYFIWFLFGMLLPMMMVFISLLAELNRTPFDFSEGESELVSGFNVEYGGLGFTFIFLSEYSMIIFSSFIMYILFFGGDYFFMLYVLMLLVYIILWVRGSLPRYRYDSLMDLTWKVFLPFSLLFLGFILGLKVYFYIK